MKFLDEEGKIFEGTPLTEEEETIWTERIDMFRVKSIDYIGMRSATKLAGIMLREYKIIKRSGVLAVSQNTTITPLVYEDVSVLESESIAAYNPSLHI